MGTATGWPIAPPGVLVDHAVGRERLGRRRRPHRQLDDGRVGSDIARTDRGDSEPRRPGLIGAGGKRTSTRSLAGTVTRLPAAPLVIGVGEDEVRALRPRRRHRAPCRSGSGRRPAARTVAEVEEARRRRPHHHRQARGDRRLALAELLGAVDRDRHHAIAREVVGQRHVDGDRSAGIGRAVGCIHGERVEVLAYVDLR